MSTLTITGDDDYGDWEAGDDDDDRAGDVADPAPDTSAEGTRAEAAAEARAGASVIPDSIEPVVGWRGFDLQTFGNGEAYQVFLKSPQQGVQWHPNEPVRAACRGEQRFVWDARPTPDYPIPPHAEAPPSPALLLPRGLSWQWVPFAVTAAHGTSPSYGCSCGIYLSQSEDDAHTYARLRTDRREQAYVIARVAGWGKTIQHEKGWRCEYAYPQEFFVLGGTREQREHYCAALEMFGVPINIGPEAEAAASASEPAGYVGPRRGMVRPLRYAMIANLAACAANLILLGLRLAS